MSFSVATAANYRLCVVLAFQRRFRRSIETLRFLIVVLIGLGFNTLLVWYFVYWFSMHPTAAKIIAVPIVLIWNYLGRRLLVFSNDIPITVRVWLKPGRKKGGDFCPSFSGSIIIVVLSGLCLFDLVTGIRLRTQLAALQCGGFKLHQTIAVSTARRSTKPWRKAIRRSGAIAPRPPIALGGSD